MKPMPSPRGTNHAGRYLPDSFWSRPSMAMDAMPQARIKGAAGARDQDDPDTDNIMIATSPAHASLLRLQRFLSDRLNPDDLASAQELLEQLLRDSDPSNPSNGNGGNGGNGMAGDRRLSKSMSYEQRFPNANRLRRR